MQVYCSYIQRAMSALPPESGDSSLAMECPLVGMLAVVVARLKFDRNYSSPKETGQASLRTARIGLLISGVQPVKVTFLPASNAPDALTAPGGQDFRRASALRVSVMMG